MAKNFNKQYPKQRQQEQQQPEDQEQVGQTDVSDPIDQGVQDASIETAAEVNQGETEAQQPADEAVEQVDEAAEQTEAAPIPVPAPEETAPVQEVVSAERTETELAAEVKPIPAAPTPVVTEAPAPTPQEEPVLSEEEAYLKKVKDSGTEAQKRILAAVETFQQALDPKRPATPEAISAAQHEFLQHLLWILKKEYEVFRGAWNALLVHFSVYHGVSTPSNYSALTEYSTDRYLYAWTKGEHTATTYRNLITVLRATRNKERRQHDIKTIVLEKVGPEVLNEHMLSNLKKFYGV